ncbi:hypothetical protein M0811_12990 [Anaeramoeba ignava]|uniref:Uncharacterized protein n=1 Tax=Anaeramoeba ignava TaxID=1746090 RepID=A0A9Q0R4U6_ANAIG|nr:hypothetical protein M0811_12990 [Anaeramoeba ignava]
MTNIPDFLNPNKEKIEKNNEIETNIIQTPKLNKKMILLFLYHHLEKKETKETNYNKIYQTKNPEIQPQITSGNYQKIFDDLNQLKRAHLFKVKTLKLKRNQTIRSKIKIKKKNIATVTRYVNPGECEKLLQIVMFTIYGKSL